MKRILLALGLTAVAGAAQATPLRLDYSVTDLGGSYQYDFVMTLDNNDGSHIAGNGYDWFGIGVGYTPGGVNTTTPFTENDAFFPSVPAGFSASYATGGLDGPVLTYGTSVSAPFWQPAIGDSFAFTGVSSALVAEGELYFSFLAGDANPAKGASVVANLSAVPVPAGLPLLIGGLALLGHAGRRRKPSA